MIVLKCCKLQQSSQQKLIAMNKISLATHEEIQKHPMNDSPAKISFRFSKTKRFKDTNPECPIAFYTYESQLSKKKSSIGSAKKSDFTKDLAKAPGSSDYNPNNYHEFTKTKGVTFGSSRQKSNDRSYLIPQIHFHPGPGAYFVEKMKNNNSSYTIRSKTIDVVERRTSFKQAPGPGAYEAVELDPTVLKTKVSKYKGPKLGAKLTERRFLQIKDAPGPLTYQTPDNFSAQARYVLSHHASRGTRPFTQQKRFRHDYWKTSKNPGPSDYEKPSDFGVYGNTALYKGLSTVL